jgi:site-specific recombinase XerD
MPPAAPVLPPGLDGALEAFVQHLKAERAMSPHTVEAYARDVKRFLHSLAAAGVTDADAALRAHVETHLGELHGAGVGPRSSARALSSLRTF